MNYQSNQGGVYQVGLPLRIGSPGDNQGQTKKYQLKHSMKQQDGLKDELSKIHKQRLNPYANDQLITVSNDKLSSLIQKLKMN